MRIIAFSQGAKVHSLQIKWAFPLCGLRQCGPTRDMTSMKLKVSQVLQTCSEWTLFSWLSSTMVWRAGSRVLHARRILWPSLQGTRPTWKWQEVRCRQVTCVVRCLAANSRCLQLPKTHSSPYPGSDQEPCIDHLLSCDFLPSNLSKQVSVGIICPKPTQLRRLGFCFCFCFFLFKTRTSYHIAALCEYSSSAKSSPSFSNRLILYICSALCPVSLRPSLQMVSDGIHQWEVLAGDGNMERSQNTSLPPPLGFGTGLAPWGSPPLSQLLGGSIFPPRLPQPKGWPQFPPASGLWVTPHSLFAPWTQPTPL